MHFPAHTIHTHAFLCSFYLGITHLIFLLTSSLYSIPLTPLFLIYIPLFLDDTAWLPFPECPPSQKQEEIPPCAQDHTAGKQCKEASNPDGGSRAHALFQVSLLPFPGERHSVQSMDLA